MQVTTSKKFSTTYKCDFRRCRLRSFGREKYMCRSDKPLWPFGVPCVYHPRVSGAKNHIMIRIILKAFLLMTLTVAAALSSVSHAQQSTTALTGEWVGSSLG